MGNYWAMGEQKLKQTVDRLNHSVESREEGTQLAMGKQKLEQIFNQ